MKKKRLLRFIINLKNNFALHAYITSAFSFFITLIFCCYNLFLGIAYNSDWNISISVYYFLIVAIRIYVGISELNRRRSYDVSVNKITSVSPRQRRLFLIPGFLLFILDFTLIVPIFLMVTQKKTVNYSMIAAITIAAYTVYKITASIIGYVKTKNIKNFNITILKSINVVDALVSVLSLQYALIMTVDGNINDNMRTLCGITGFAIWAIILIFCSGTLIKSVRECKKDHYFNVNKTNKY